MEQIELNVIESFRRCKNDIIKIQNKVTELSQAQERIMEQISNLRKKITVKPVTVTRTVVRKVPSKPKVIVKKVKSKPKVIVKKVKSKPKVIVKTVHARAKKVYVASKTSNVVHDKNCPFAKNIKPKSRIIFKSKTAALNKGYKLCECLKK